MNSLCSPSHISTSLPGMWKISIIFPIFLLRRTKFFFTKRKVEIVAVSMFVLKRIFKRLHSSLYVLVFKRPDFWVMETKTFNHHSCVRWWLVRIYISHDIPKFYQPLQSLPYYLNHWYFESLCCTIFPCEPQLLSPE